MTVSNRLLTIELPGPRFLNAGDRCMYFGEHVAHGGFSASETNQQIHNLKIPVNAPLPRLHWKQQATLYWANKLARALNMDVVAEAVTFVPVPPSKASDHPEYDPRMHGVLTELARISGRTLDVRPLVIQTASRTPQHHGARKTPDEFIEIYALNKEPGSPPLRSHVLVVDDVITRGASFSATKQFLRIELGLTCPIDGLFMAKSVHVD